MPRKVAKNSPLGDQKGTSERQHALPDVAPHDVLYIAMAYKVVAYVVMARLGSQTPRPSTCAFIDMCADMCVDMRWVLPLESPRPRRF